VMSLAQPRPLPANTWCRAVSSQPPTPLPHCTAQVRRPLNPQKQKGRICEGCKAHATMECGWHSSLHSSLPGRTQQCWHCNHLAATWTRTCIPSLGQPLLEIPCLNHRPPPLARGNLCAHPYKHRRPSEGCRPSNAARGRQATNCPSRSAQHRWWHRNTANVCAML
jgi:hypothetical protein